MDDKLKFIDEALFDWLRTFADTEFDPKDVNESYIRIGERHGTIGYICDARNYVDTVSHELDTLRAQLRASREALAKAEAELSVEEVDPDDCRESVLKTLRAALQSTPQLAKNEGEKPSTNAHIHGIKS